MTQHRGTAALLTCALLLTATACSGASGERAGRPTPKAVAHTVSRSPVVMAVGDSFTVGSGPVRSWNTYLAGAARQLGWQPVIAGASGTGYLNRGRAGRNFLASFTDELSWRPAPDLLIISGGHNDRRWTPRRVGTACYRLITTAKKRWPKTRVIVIGPIWMTPAPSWALDVRDSVSSAARRAGVAFLDPLPGLSKTAGADTGGGSELVLPDGVHPTPVGHQRLARWLVDSLREMPLSQ
ncbi:SGNH/GDSL hydrolase family protein [Spongiactinospora sp. TRM90649]|uniref:SGNH/GDSL hydrolase family protein n=1 Tax=Spongiactinospora sp. TRM90649 TaxID=3031114 RepID=UPI0023F64BA1|nr:SGNH/GDSL hydrolase family protein [Spongiactinospora sp. TRM90649]MDF5751726.1 SGNH/GDSL hydrolase family protein [Spongiactinospora sp. TRM90649]